jgi:hypothetical protein
MASGNKQVRTGTALPAFQGFDPGKASERLSSFCDKFHIDPETIRRIIVEPVLQSGEVISFMGEAPLYAYACGTQTDAITRMAEKVMVASGIAQNPEAKDAKLELWRILRDFSVGYGIPVEEQLGLITKRGLQDKFNFQSVHTLTAMRFMMDLAGRLEGHLPSFGRIKSAYIDIWPENMGPETFSAVFNMFIQGQVPTTQEDGSALNVFPTHCRSLTTPPLKPDTPYIVSTTNLSGAYSLASILPPEESLGIRLDLLLWRKADTLIIADVTGSFA